MDKLTKNNFFDGTITIYQSEKGYRFSIDPILLSAHVKPLKDDKILDIGTGSGIIPISIAYKNKNIDITGVEIQKRLFEIAKKNICENNFENKIKIIHDDILNTSQKDLNGPFDIIVSNPPYQKPGSGRINPDSEKALARHELKLDLKKLLKKVRSLLKNKGKFFIIYPANRASELIYEMEKNHIAPKIIRFIHSFQNTNAVMVICQGISNGNSGVDIMPPLVIYDYEDKYSKEVSLMMK